MASVERPAISETTTRVPLPTRFGLDVLVEVGAAGHGAGVQAALVGEDRVADVGLLRVGCDVDQLGDVVGHRRQALQAVGRDGADVQLERQVGDGGRQVGVAGPLAVAVDAALHLGHPGLDGDQRVGHGAAGVVVAVDAELRARCAPARRPRPGRRRRAASRRWCRTAPAPRRRPPRPQPGRTGRSRDCGGSRRRSAPHRGRRAGRARAGSARSRPPWPPPRRATCAGPRPRGGPRTWPRCRRPAHRRRSGWPARRRSRASRRPGGSSRTPPAWRVARRQLLLARAKNSTSLGLAPGQPPSMKVTPRWSSCSATRSLSSTVSERPSCWLPSRRMVSKMSTASGRSGTA